MQEGFSPSGFSIDSNEEEFLIIEKWSIYFKPYLIYHFEKGGSGADISFLKNKNNVLVGFRPILKDILSITIQKMMSFHQLIKGN